MIAGHWLGQAALRIDPRIWRTLLTNGAELNLHLEWENMQVTGSFEARGALDKALALAPCPVSARRPRGRCRPAAEGPSGAIEFDARTLRR